MTSAETSTPERIPVAAARNHIRSGALLVCAYADEDKCRQSWLDGAITLKELERRAVSLPKEQEIIFYCA